MYCHEYVEEGISLRADRLLSIVLLLQAHRRLTAPDLAERLEVSVRTIHRDMDALSSAGVPVVADRGPGGGWQLARGYQTRLTGLSPDEVRSIFVQPVALLSDLGLGRSAEAAALKLLAAVPGALRKTAESARNRIHIDPAGWRGSGEDLSVLPLLQEAVWSERRLHIAYRRADGSAGEREVDPLGLVAKGSVWYLVAGRDGELRTYRVSRIVAAEVRQQPCARPAAFDLAAYWQQSVASFKHGLPRYPATVRVRAQGLARLRRAWYVHIREESPPDREGWVQLQIEFEVEWEALDYALRFGSDLEVMTPERLRERVRAELRAMGEVYGLPAAAARA